MAGVKLILICMLALLLSLVHSYAITGVEGGVNQFTGQRPSRQEFATFKDSGPALDLYILSLQQLQQQNQSSLLSYYQVAGIHGYPFVSWDGVQGTFQAGYCTHESILFPAWHRPYVALFEQLLWTNAQQIAATYPPAQQVEYQAAATSFRIPYWDWALNATIPDPVNDPRISINTPTGVQSIINPLYNYTFNPQPSPSDFPPSESLSKYHSTVRYPTTSGQSQPNLANQALQANAQVLHDLTYQLLADTSSYAPFANAAYSDGRGAYYNSIENMHNAIHSLAGGSGHMGIIPFASFDPIFWLHHANVDRLFAIWQAIYPGSYTTPYANAEGTFTNALGETEDIDTALTPFHSTDSSTLHTSATVRSTRTFGYTYPELIDWNINATQLSSNVRTIINKLYNPTGSIATRSLTHSSLSERQLQQNHTSQTYPNTTEEYQYSINIRLDRTSLTSPINIHFFLAPVPSTPSTWSYAPTLIGTHSVPYHSPPPPLTSRNTTISHLTNTTTSPLHPLPPRLTHGQIPLTHSLPSLAPAHILPHLSTHLTWRIQDPHNANSSIPTSSIHGLQISVIGRRVLKQAAGDQFPVYGEWEVYPAATAGKEGGLGVGEGI